MRPEFRTGFRVGIGVALFTGIFLLRLWQPERQVRLHSEHLVRQIESRSWSRVGNFVATSYRDQWDEDRATLLARLHFAFRFFTDVEITADDPVVQAANGQGSWSAKIRIAGSGVEFVEEIKARANQVADPFVLHWRRETWRPWDWKLVSVTNPGFAIPAELD
jgi:hypothetical protein